MKRNFTNRRLKLLYTVFSKSSKLKQRQKLNTYSELNSSGHTLRKY